VRRLTAWLLPLLVLLGGCGVGTQPEPEIIEISGPPADPPDPATAFGAPEVTVYFVRGAHLEPVLRPATAADVPTALTALTSGPTRGEVVGGLRTALAPQALQATTPLEGSTVEIAVTRDFTSVTGANQLLAVAQVVWTVTELSYIEGVRFIAEGWPLEVPTDEGLTDEAVDRADYRSVAPPAGGAARPSASGTPAPSAGTTAATR
jgi:spore germination protein GerM